MILPKLSAAILSMSCLGSAYGACELHRDISLDQWVVISGAANGAATLFGASPQDLVQHRNTAYAHLTRYATENSLDLQEFDPLFERGVTEGQRLLQAHSSVIAPKCDNLLAGFQNDKSITYQDVKLALSKV